MRKTLLFLGVTVAYCSYAHQNLLIKHAFAQHQGLLVSSGSVMHKVRSKMVSQEPVMPYNYKTELTDSAAQRKIPDSIVYANYPNVKRSVAKKRTIDINTASLLRSLTTSGLSVTNALTLKYGFTGQPLTYDGTSAVDAIIDTTQLRTVANSMSLSQLNSTYLPRATAATTYAPAITYTSNTIYKGNGTTTPVASSLTDDGTTVTNAASNFANNRMLMSAVGNATVATPTSGISLYSSSNQLSSGYQLSWKNISGGSVSISSENFAAAVSVRFILPGSGGLLMSNPLTTAGDIPYLSANSTTGTNVSRLPIGANKTVLMSNGTLPGYALIEPTNTDTTSTGFATQKTLLQYKTAAQNNALYAPISGSTSYATTSLSNVGQHSAVNGVTPVVSMAGNSIELQPGNGITSNSVMTATSMILNNPKGTLARTGHAGSININDNGTISLSTSYYGAAGQNKPANPRIFIDSIGIQLLPQTASRALYLDSTRHLVSSSVTPTELGYLSGATSSIQTQLNGLSTGLTNVINGSGTSGYVPKFTAAKNIGNSLLYDDGTNVGIGTASPDSKLTVNGTVHAKQVLVNVNIYPDYVFKPDYNLPSLASVKAYIDKNHHLPDVPTEAEVVKNGLKVGESESMLLKKVEELTLYLIEKDDQLKKLQKEVDELKASSKSQSNKKRIKH